MNRNASEYLQIGVQRARIPHRPVYKAMDLNFATVDSNLYESDSFIIKYMESERNLLQSFADFVDLGADFLTILASGLAIYLFFTQKDKIGSAFNLLLRFSLQVTLSELQNKIDRLNEYTAGDSKQLESIINILKEIEGQIKGNRFLKVKLAQMVVDIENFTDKPAKITEGRKRSLVAELREQLRDIDISEYNKFAK